MREAEFEFLPTLADSGYGRIAASLHAILSRTGGSMAPLPIYEAFKRTECTYLTLFVQIPASKALLSRIRSCLGGRRKNLPYNFAALYPGEGKGKIGAHAILTRSPRKGLLFQIIWFEAKEGPPSQFGSLHDLLGCVGTDTGESEAFVTATFSYDKERVASLFKPIQLADQPAIFDEITGMTGVKRNPEGKMVYQLEVSFGGERVNHTVRFTQGLRLSEDTPLSLLEAASRISVLALKHKEAL